MQMFKDIPYATHPDADQPTRQFLDLYIPSTTSDRSMVSSQPIIILVHGGAWRANSRSNVDFVKLAETFASQHGIATVVLGYRMSSKTVQHPKHTQDVAQGCAWVLKCLVDARADNNNAVEARQALRQCAGISPRIYLVGHSVGATMSFLLGLETPYLAEALQSAAELEQSKALIQGFIGLEGIYDYPLLAKAYPTYVDWFYLAALGQESEGNWKDVSPTQHGKGKGWKADSVRWLVVHSPNDELVNMEQAEVMVGHLKSLACGKVDVVGTEGANSPIQGKHDEMLREPQLVQIIASWISKDQ